MKDYEKAIRDYTHAILIDNQDSNAFLGRADAFRLQGNLDAAIKDYEAVANIMNGPNIGDGEITDNKDQAAQAYNYKGEICCKQERYEEALIEFNNALRCNPKFIEAYFNRGITYSDLHRRKEAIADFTQTIDIILQKYKTTRHMNNEAVQIITETLIKDCYDKLLVAAFYRRGRNYYKLSMNDNAIQDYTRAIELDDQYALAYYFRTWIYREEENYEKAIEDYNKVLLVDNENKEGYTYKSLKYRAFCYEKLSHYEKAIECYSETIEFRNEYAVNYLSRANLYLKFKKYKEAIQDYNYVILKDNKCYEAFLGRADAYRELGDLDSAISDYEKAMKLRK